MLASRLIAAYVHIGVYLVVIPLPLVADHPVFTRPSQVANDQDFQIQGEYVGKLGDGRQLGLQVVALGDGRFEGYLYPGGLPGDVHTNPG